MATTFLKFRELQRSLPCRGFLHKLSPCFDTAFEQLEVIPRRGNKFVEIVAAEECYLITNQVKRKNQRSSRPEYVVP